MPSTLQGIMNLSILRPLKLMPIWQPLPIQKYLSPFHKVHLKHLYPKSLLIQFSFSHPNSNAGNAPKTRQPYRAFNGFILSSFPALVKNKVSGTTNPRPQKMLFRKCQENTQLLFAPRPTVVQKIAKKIAILAA